MKTTTGARLKEIMLRTGLRQVDILEKCKPYCQKYGIEIRRGDLSQYVSDKVRPNQYRLTILSLALGVSEAYLMGYDVPQTTPSQSALTPAESQLLERFRMLTGDQQTAVDILMDTYINQNKKAALLENAAM